MRAQDAKAVEHARVRGACDPEPEDYPLVILTWRALVAVLAIVIAVGVTRWLVPW